MTDYNISYNMKEVTPDAKEEALKRISEMLDDRLNDAEMALEQAKARVSVIEDLIHEVDLIRQHLITY